MLDRRSMEQGRRRAAFEELGARSRAAAARVKRRAYGVGLRMGRWAARRRRVGRRLERQKHRTARVRARARS